MRRSLIKHHADVKVPKQCCNVMQNEYNIGYSWSHNRDEMKTYNYFLIILHTVCLISAKFVLCSPSHSARARWSFYIVHTFIAKISMIQRSYFPHVCVHILFCFDDFAESIEWDISQLRFVVIAVGNEIRRNTLSFHLQIEFYFCVKIANASHPLTEDALGRCNWFLIHLGADWWVWTFPISFTQSAQNIGLGIRRWTTVHRICDMITWF